MRKIFFCYFDIYVFFGFFVNPKNLRNSTYCRFFYLCKLDLFFTQGEILSVTVDSVFHETWQFVNSFECLLPYTALDIIDHCSWFSLKNLLLKYILLWIQFYYDMAGIQIFYIILLGSNNLTHYGRRHFKLFTNCHISWDTLYKLKKN